MKRLMEYTVFSGLVTAWRLATWPTSRSPVLVMATTDGVVRAPSWLGITTGSPPCMTATTELVVPKSIPKILCANRSSAELQGGQLNARLSRRPFDAGESIKVECMFVKIVDACSKYF